MQAIEMALDRFAVYHEGKLPTAVVITRAATLALAAGSDFKVSSLRSVPVKIEEFAAYEVVKPGEGSRLGIFVNDNGAQLHVEAVDLR
jgi:hypothetical protein